MKGRVLVVDDDLALSEMLSIVLRQEGLDVTHVADGTSAVAAFRDSRPDLVLLDVMLPGMDGMEVCRRIRAESGVPIVMLTARTDTVDVVVGLESGADDYVVKPFGGEQLEARIRAVLRRAGTTETTTPEIVVGDIVINPASREVTLRGASIELSRKEFDLLHLLASRAGEVVTKREILADVWRQAYGGGDRTVDVHLSWLRRKLGETAAEPVYLHSVRGVGVRMSPPDAG